MYKQRIFNLTQHAPSAEQLEAGVQNLPLAQQEEMKALLTFENIPSKEEMQQRANRLAELVHGIDPNASAMIGGAPFFMSALENALMARNIKPMYAFSQRESVEITQDDGSVKKTAIFRHVGFVSPF